MITRLKPLFLNNTYSTLVCITVQYGHFQKPMLLSKYEEKEGKDHKNISLLVKQ